MAGKIDLEDSVWCEQVFEGKNKSYGAYDLRKRYSSTLRKSTILAVIFFSLAIAAPLIAKIISGMEPEDNDIKVVQANELMAPPPLDKAQPPPPPPPSEPPPPPVRTTIKFTPPVVKKDEEVHDEPPPVQEEIKAQVGTETVKGKDTGPPPVEEPTISGNGNAVVEESNEVFYHVEENPEYPGGIDQIGKFIGKTLRYPPMARETGVQGRVTVTFVVEKDGSITDVTVLRGIGSGCDEEAVRVIKAMPKWKPGKQNGKPVRVHFSLPIMFRLD
ncbi:energy transducer TonB [Solitalea koreensis]|uniref:Outer membrane transport energization protein TonB n=1 Tax=Solitalea koreensis TaxID=543615 RepID=A0A521C6A3_9SPHI|nr:energy transducer TonB [Solitalea koreensis]SMO54895.1 outer membrane transport energization protein TonB [Solitalea koreensis]